VCELIVIGGGLAGSEAAFQAAQRGINVKLFEMRPVVETGAHITSKLAELVCSNSLGSNLPDRASGLLKEELRKLGSLLIECADKSSIPAGRALAVDREKFSEMVSERLEKHPKITIVREEVKEIPIGLPVIIASGPLTSGTLSQALQLFTGSEHLYFYDAIAPIVYKDSINMDIAFQASRYDEEIASGDYINCPFDQDKYVDFVSELMGAKRIQLKSFEADLESGVRAGAHQYFESCLPVEVLAAREFKALAFGPMRPVGITNPHIGRRPYAVVQLRQDNLSATLYNLVGFQTNLTFPEQQRIFRMIPGLENAEFARYGQMHRNTFIFSPTLLLPSLQAKKREDLFFAGQITGVEGYAGNIATGLLAGVNAANYIQSLPLLEFPKTTMIGALCQYIATADAADFQPMKANFGILPPLEIPGKVGKRERAFAYSQQSLRDLDRFLQKIFW
jgi:methylenetetrahydrofolate--tRNA-(uracil-5-)-methyltransferase